MNRIQNDLLAIEQETLNLIEGIDLVKNWYMHQITDHDLKSKLFLLLTASHPDDSEYLERWLTNHIACGREIKHIYSTRTLLFALTVPSFTDSVNSNIEISNKMQICRHRLIKHYKQAVKECALKIPHGK